MAIDERTSPAPTRTDPPPRRSWWRRAWIAPLAVITAAFLIYALPPYLGLDPARSRLPADRHPLFYPVLVTHIFAGSLMLGCAVLQLWPWLRRTHRAVHRWSGRIYVLMVIPVGLGSLFIAQFPSVGPNQQVANSFLSVLLLVTTFCGYRAVRQHRFADHREWMIRSFALAFSIVTNRFWGFVLVMIFAPTATDFTDPALQAAASASAWVSWVVNLLIAEWWLRRKPLRTTKDLVAAGQI
jgi:uncharacterized membrane protein